MDIGYDLIRGVGIVWLVCAGIVILFCVVAYIFDRGYQKGFEDCRKLYTWVEDDASAIGDVGYEL